MGRDSRLSHADSHGQPERSRTAEYDVLKMQNTIGHNNARSKISSRLDRAQKALIRSMQDLDPDMEPAPPDLDLPPMRFVGALRKEYYCGSQFLSVSRWDMARLSCIVGLSAIHDLELMRRELGVAQSELSAAIAALEVALSHLFPSALQDAYRSWEAEWPEWCGNDCSLK